MSDPISSGAADFDRLMRALCEPSLYDHPVERVELIETHISGVLLAGDYVYKVKKPVDFGFVDFTTLDKRRHFCEEELRLNRRFAPGLYLDVIAIRGTPGAPTFGRQGQVLDYAVRMKRFDQQSLLDRCIRREGLVTGAMMETFAADVAAVHGGAERAAPGNGYGSPAVVGRNMSECWPPIEAAGFLQDAGAAGLVHDMNTCLEACRPWIEQRLTDGRVRECHGDLHLGNLFLDGGRIRAFDCIEFNPHLRWIDVANDIAFFTMDLRFHDKSGFARRFRNAYLDVTGDYSLLHLLRFYELYRAIVRAKVACLRGQEEAGAGRADAEAHLTLALDLTGERGGTPLIITHGLSGAGKTHVSTSLIEQSEAIRIRSDVARNHVVAGDAKRYSDVQIENVYRYLHETARRILEAGYPVIVDATFLERAHRDNFRALAAELEVPFHILHCNAPEAELRRRITERLARGGDASEADPGVLDLQLRQREPLTPAEQASAYRYDTTDPPDIPRVLADLGLGNGEPS